MMIAKLLLVLIAVSLLGAPAAALDRIRIAVSNPNMPNLTVAVAQKQGFFKDENVATEIIRMNPNVAITALSTGDVDYCQLFGAVGGGAIAGLPVRIVAGYLDMWPVTLIAQPEIKSLKELVAPYRQTRAFAAVRGLFARTLRYPPLTPALRVRLAALYAEDIAGLSELLGRDLSIWRCTDARDHAVPADADADPSRVDHAA